MEPVRSIGTDIALGEFVVGRPPSLQKSALLAQSPGLVGATDEGGFLCTDFVWVVPPEAF